jgi:DNA-binding CsgD family transcriptional regulator
VRHGQALGFTILADAASYRDHTPPFGAAARLVGIGRGDGHAPGMTDLHERLDQLVTAGPVLIAVDDCQWLDPESVEWLCTLPARYGHRRLAVLLAVGAGEPSRDHELIEELQALCTRQLHLPDLDNQAIGSLLAGRLGSAPDAVFTAACAELTTGNPLLLTLVADALLEHGVEPIAGNVGALRTTDVSALTPILRARLRRISPHAQTVAEVLTVLGNATTLNEVAELAGLTPAVVAETVRTLADTGLIAKQGATVGLTHEVCRLQLARGVAYAALQSTHLQAAELMARIDAPAERVAQHLLAAPAVGAQWAHDVLRQAADDAVLAGNHEAAAGYLTRLAAEPMPVDSRADAVLDLAEIAARSGGQAALEHIAAALSLPLDDAQVGRALAALTDVRHLTGADNPVRRTDGPAAIVAELQLQHEVTAGEGIRWLIGSEADGEVDHDARHLSLLAQHESWSGRSPESARTLAERALAASHAPRDMVARLRAIEALADAEQADTARQACDAAVAAAQDDGHLVYAAASLAVRSGLNHRLGRLPAAVADAQAALSTAAAQEWPVPHHVARLVDALTDTGDVPAAYAALAAVAAERHLSGTLGGVQLRFSRGRLAIAAGDVERGIDDLMLCADQLTAWQARDWPGLPWRTESVEALLAANQPAEALDLAEQDLSHSRSWGLPGAVGRALRSRGTARPGAAGLIDLAQSVELLSSSQWHLELARSLVAYGSALSGAGRRAEARDVLRSGFQLAHRCGAAPLAERARSEHRAAGGRLGRQRADPVTLSAAEMRVANLVTDNMTNARIARTLSIGVRTVEAHLTQCYRKLSVHGRAELIETWRQS